MANGVRIHGSDLISEMGACLMTYSFVSQTALKLQVSAIKSSANARPFSKQTADCQQMKLREN